MQEISLRQYLSELGWKSAYLGNHGAVARVGRSQGHACFEPFGFFQRRFTTERMKIAQAFPPGTRIKFLCSLKFDVISDPQFWHYVAHPLAGLMRFFLGIFMLFSGKSTKDFENMCQLEGDVELYPNPRFSEFPFDQILTVQLVEALSITLLEENGQTWRLPHVDLATVNQITVLRG